MNSKRTLFILGLIILGVASRFLPHPPNFTAVSAIGLFTGARLDKKYLAFLLPVVIMLMSDLMIGLHDTLLAVYASMLISVVLGFVLSKNTKPANIVGFSLLSSVIFFLVTNFAAWLSGSLGYSLSFAGLIQCYTMAVPFFGNTIAGDLVFNGVFFGAFYLASVKFPTLVKN